MNGREVARPTRLAPSVVDIVYLSNGFSLLYIRGNQAQAEMYLKFGVVKNPTDEVLESYMHTRFHLDPPKHPPKSKKHSDQEFVHLRCAYNNKYLVAVESVVRPCSKPVYLMGTADEPEEDLSKPWCTLFRVELLAHHDGPYFQNQVCFHRPDEDQSVGFYCGDDNIYFDVHLDDAAKRIIMPKYVVFKGDNSFYLRVDDKDYLQFSSSDVNEASARFAAFNYSCGRVRIQSAANGKFLRLTADRMWVYADATSIEDGTLFIALKFSDFIALQPDLTDIFCMSLNQGNIDWLGTGDSITEKAKLRLEEPVLEREIYNIQYHGVDHSRIYDTTNMNMVTASAVNMTSEKNTIKSSLAITTRESSKWEATDTPKAGISVKLSAETKLNVLGFVDIKTGLEVQLGHEFARATNWGTSSETEKKQEVEYQVTVPANKKVTLTVIATQAKYDVPFSYTQKDTLPNGEIKIYNYDDGLYSGMNSFDLHYETKEEEIIVKRDEEEIETPSKKKKRRDVLLTDGRTTSNDQERRVISSYRLIK
ncbi:unnamed protein product [Urochloa decumbens]|uniref:Agglutinin domain-containing protein n=1 Tax=Urochloa decumbens TaxID=240449 RepID=A0ABC9B1B5_9POAL